MSAIIYRPLQTSDTDAVFAIAQEAGRFTYNFRNYLLPAYIGRGIGSEVLRCGEAFLQSQGLDRTFCFLHKDNELGTCFVPSSLLRTEGAGMMCQTARKRVLAAMRSGLHLKNDEGAARALSLSNGESARQQPA